MGKSGRQGGLILKGETACGKRAGRHTSHRPSSVLPRPCPTAGLSVRLHFLHFSASWAAVWRVGQWNEEQGVREVGKERESQGWAETE